MLLKPLERVTAREYRANLALNQPVIIVGAATDWPVMQTLQFSRIRRSLGTVKVPVRQSDNEFQVFFGDASEEVGPRKMMSLAEYLDAIESSDNSARRPPYAGNIAITKDPAVARTLGTLTTDCRFPRLNIEACSIEYRLWIGACGQRSTIHNDPYHNLNTQIVGQKRFIAFAPEQHQKLYPVFFHRAMWASPIDPMSPDLARYPQFEDAHGFEGVLDPGDLLYLPRFWWHCAEALVTCVNINQWVYSGSCCQWWHEQPEARSLIVYKDVLDQQTRKFELLSRELQECFAADFIKLKAELLHFAEEQSRVGE